MPTPARRSPALQVTVLTVNSGFVAGGFTNASGVYSISVPPGALYYVATDNRRGHLAEAFPDVRCVSHFCSPNDLREAEPFSMPPGGSVTGRNLRPVRGGTISGTVTNAAGAAVRGATVTAWFRLGVQTFRGQRHQLRGRVLDRRIECWHLFPRTTFNSQGLRNEIYPDLPCILFCSATNALAIGAPVPVSAGTAITGPELHARGRRLDQRRHHQRRDRTAAADAIVSVRARVEHRRHRDIRALRPMPTASTPSAGLPPQPTSCSRAPAPRPMRCIPISSASTSVIRRPRSTAAGRCREPRRTNSGINLALDPGLASPVPSPMNRPGCPCRIPDRHGLPARRTDLLQPFGLDQCLWCLHRLRPRRRDLCARHRRRARSPTRSTTTCPAPVVLQHAAQLAAGTPVSVTPGGTATGRNFALQPLAFRHRDAHRHDYRSSQRSTHWRNRRRGLCAVGLGVHVLLHLRAPTSLACTAARSPLARLPRRHVRLHPYRNEAFDNVPCLALRPLLDDRLFGSTPVTITAGGTATANFGLSAGDGIAGTVTDAATGAPLAGVQSSSSSRDRTCSRPASTPTSAGSSTCAGCPTAITSLTPATAWATSTRSIATSAARLPVRRRPPSPRGRESRSTERPPCRRGSRGAGDGHQLRPRRPNPGPERTEQPPNRDGRLDRRCSPGRRRHCSAAARRRATCSRPASRLAPRPSRSPSRERRTTFSVPGVPPGTYFVRIKAVNAHGTSLPSNEVMLVVGAAAWACRIRRPA